MFWQGGGKKRVKQQLKKAMESSGGQIKVE
jgi:hypothetical protein